MAGFEPIGRGKDMNLIFDNFARPDRLKRIARQPMKGFAGFRALRIERAIRRLQPSARQLALRQIRNGDAAMTSGRVDNRSEPAATAKTRKIPVARAARKTVAS